MIFTPAELQSSLPVEARRHPATWMREQLRLLAPGLAQKNGSYKSYGPYWWQLKHLLRTCRIGTRAWFQGSWNDDAVFSPQDPGDPVLNLQAVLLYQELHDNYTLSIDELHCVTWPDGTSSLYEASDPDGGHQLDLFELDSIRARRDALFIREPAAYLPRPWKDRGNAAREQGMLWRAAFCYLRAIGTPYGADIREKSDAWLLLAQTYEELGHFSKAYFCYETLYAKDQEGWVLGAMAHALHEQGHYTRALETWERALAISPGNPEFQAGRARTRELCTMQDERPGRSQNLLFPARAS